MMPQRNPLCPAMDQSDPDLPSRRCQVDCTTEVAVEGGQRNGGGAASSSPESSSVNGDVNGKRSGKRRRRRKRSAQPDNRPAPVAMVTQPPPPPGQEQGEEPQLCQGGSSHTSTNPAPDSPSAVLLGLRSECGSVWFDRSVYEQAESLYHCWLAHSANGAMTRPSGSPPTLTADNHPTSPQPSLSPSAPNHPRTPPPIVAEEHRIVAEPLQPAAPDFLALPANSPSTPDEGYLSLTQTPQAASTSPLTPALAPGQPVNGLPRLPMELLRDVWLEKPLYDRAEAAFYQSLYGSNRSPTGNNLGSGASASRTNPNAPSTSRGSGDHPHSLVEEEEEEEETEVVEEASVVSQGKLEIFHSLRTIQEEEEPADVAEEEGVAMSVGGVCYFLHPDSERVWLDQGRYEAAESRFYSYRQIVPAESTVADREEGARGKEDAGVSATSLPQPSSSSVACSGPLRDNTMSSAVDYIVQEKIWFDKPRYDEAERHFYEHINSTSHPAQELGANTILQDIARARENIQKSLAGLKNSLLPSRGFDQPQNPHPSAANGAGDQGELITRIKSLELENHSLHQVVEDLRSALSKLECRVAVLEKSPSAAPVSAAPCTNGTSVQQQKTSPPVEDIDDDDDDMDLFGSDEEEDAEAERIKEQRLKEYAEKKAKKPTLIAKSSILLDVKPWDDETDMVKLEECVRSVVADGLLWGQSKLVPVGYGIRKLQIQCVVEDDKVGTDLLEEEITKFEDYVQSVDVAAFNKI
ncbi:hypothetical protein J4Q44_G00202650 [Coregonus suidteri]|uniref:Elongation factor 1-delta n=1 Tax=Coregonus suidteri TaxID=861788 RepID=A0AAN8LHU7_9TELE